MFTAKVVSNSSWKPQPVAQHEDVGRRRLCQHRSRTTRNVDAARILPPGAQRVAGRRDDQSATDQLPTAVKTLGVYVQEQAGLRDRLFLTVAVRTDQNSAFGTNFQRVFYPKASLSWIVSDESFFPKLRLPEHTSGFARRTASPACSRARLTRCARSRRRRSTSTARRRPGSIENALGNAEPQAGAFGRVRDRLRDAVLFNKRLNIDFTYYNKKTKDALISLPIAASAAPSATTVRSNLGSVSNTGYEASINAQLIDRPLFGWDVTLSGSHNTQQGAVRSASTPSGKPNKTIGTGAIRDSAGFPVNGVFLRPYHYADANDDGIIQSSEVTVDTGVVYMGYSAPRDLASVAERLRSAHAASCGSTC